jgi:hypothetical protein
VAQVLDDRMVEVQAADVLQALLGQHVEPGLGAAHHGGVEGAAAEVVDGQAPADRHLAPCTAVKYDAAPTGSGSAAACRAGLPGPLDEGTAAPITPPGRVGDPDLLRGRRRAWRRASVATWPSTRPNTCATGITWSPRKMLPSSTLRFGLGSKRLGSRPGMTFGVTADEHPSVGAEVHRRRQQR